MFSESREFCLRLLAFEVLTDEVFKWGTRAIEWLRIERENSVNDYYHFWRRAGTDKGNIEALASLAQEISEGSK